MTKEYVECTCKNGIEASNCAKNCGHGEDLPPTTSDPAQPMQSNCSVCADKDREINKLNDSMTVLIRRVAELEERLTVANVKISFWRDSWNKSDREHTLAINRILELEQTVSELEGNVSEDDGYVYCPNCGRVKLD